jgi:hypothetical protein
MGTDDRAHEACRTLSKDELKSALEAGANVASVLDTTLMIETCTIQGDRHLLLRAEDVRIQMIDLLLLHGAHINQSDPRDGETPLMAASQDGLTRVVQHLLRRGADPTMVDCEGRTADWYHWQGLEGQGSVLRSIEDENLSKSAWLVLPQLKAAIGGESGYASGGTELDYLPEGGTQPDGGEDEALDSAAESEHPSQQDSPISMQRMHEKRVATEAPAVRVATEAAAELETAERAGTAVASAPVLEMERTLVPSLVPSLELEAASTAMVPATSVESEKSLEEMKASLNAILGQTSTLLSKWTGEVQRDPADHEPLPLKEQGGEQSDELEEQRSAEASVQPLDQEVEELQNELAAEELELRELKARLLARLDGRKDGEDKQGGRWLMNFS